MKPGFVESEIFDEIANLCDTQLFTAFASIPNLINQHAFEILLETKFAPSNCVDIVKLYMQPGGFVFSNGLPTEDYENYRLHGDLAGGMSIFNAWASKHVEIVDILKTSTIRQLDAVYWACFYGDPELIRYLDEEPSFDMLKIAAEANRVNIIQAFDNDLSFESIDTLLQTAITHDSIDVINYILEKPNVDGVGVISLQCLSKAVLKRNRRLLAILLKRKHENISVLPGYAVYIGDLEMFNYLVQNGGSGISGLVPAVITKRYEFISEILTRFKVPKNLVLSAIQEAHKRGDQVAYSILISSMI